MLTTGDLGWPQFLFQNRGHTFALAHVRASPSRSASRCLHSCHLPAFQSKKQRGVMLDSFAYASSHDRLQSLFWGERSKSCLNRPAINAGPLQSQGVYVVNGRRLAVHTVVHMPCDASIASARRYILYGLAVVWLLDWETCIYLRPSQCMQ